MPQLIKKETAQAIQQALERGLPELPRTRLHVPEYGYFATPGEGDTRLWELVFPNGFSITAGLLAETMGRFPFTWPIGTKMEYDQYAAIPRPPQTED